MIRRKGVRLRTRLLLSYVAVCGIGVGVLFLVVERTAPSFFQERLEHMGGGFGQGPGGPGGQPGQGQAQRLEEAAELDRAMSRSLRQGLLVASGIALSVGVVASVLLARQVGAPARRLAAASSRIAQGQYGERVMPEGPPEFRELASSFNAMAASLESVEQRRKDLIGDVAHELRTPIAVISGYIEGLADGVFPAGEDTWTKMSDEATGLGRLVEELGELSRAESGTLALSLVEVAPGEAITRASERLESQFEERGLRLTVDVPANLPAVRADFERLVQILTNLLVNALRYTPSPGEVRVSAHRTRTGVAFAVSDTGVGIAPDDLAHIFERFYRVDRSRSRSSGGSGIGLTIARALADAMGGTLTAESAGPGHGSEFTLVLPESTRVR